MQGFSKILFGALIISYLAVPFTLRAEIFLNEDRWGRQTFPSLAHLSNGSIAVAWSSTENQDWNGPRFNIYSPDLTPVFGVEMYLAQFQSYAWVSCGLAASEDGFFVAAHMRPFENGGENYDIFIRKLDNDGNYLTNDIRVNSDTSNYQWFINMFIDDATDVIIVVYGTRVDSNPNLKHYYFRQFDFDLNPISDDTPLYVSDDETINEFRAGFLPPSKIIAIWQQEYNIIGDRELLLRHMSFDGSESSEPISMHNQEFGNYFSPNITPISSGGALLLWGAVDDYSIGAIWARRIDGNGEFIDQNDRPISYPTYISSLLHQTPYASYNPEGDLLAVCWVQDGDGSGPETYRVFERIFNSELVALSDTSKISLFDSYEFYSTWDPINYFIGSDSVFTVWSAYINSYDDDDILATTTQINPTDIANEGPELPRLIFTAYPNPFNVQTKLSYELPKASNVTITVYNIQGQVVNILRNEKQPAGFHEVIWDASDLSSGIYFYRLQAGDVTETRKISLLK